MKLPRRRSSRPRAYPRTAAAKDVKALKDAERWLNQLQTDPANGTTVPLAALRDQPHYAPPDPASHPYPAPPAAVLRMPQARAVMTVNPPGPGVPGPTPQALEVTRFLRAKVIILKRRGHLDRISQDKLAMLPADRIRNRRTTARLIVDEAAELLLCGGDTR
jgi:hypothetical protein